VKQGDEMKSWIDVSGDVHQVRRRLGMKRVRAWKEERGKTNMKDEGSGGKKSKINHALLGCLRGRIVVKTRTHSRKRLGKTVTSQAKECERRIHMK